MGFKRIKDFTTKTWYVDYKDECGLDTYGPDTHEGCTKFIQHNNARTSAGERFDVERGPYQKETNEVNNSKIQDGSLEEKAAEYAIDSDKVMDLYEMGQTIVKAPKGLDIHEFAQACISFIYDLWGEPEVNFYYEDADFNYRINKDNTVTIFVVK